VAGCLRLLSLRCNDAQGVTDEVYLTVDDQQIWGPASMKTESSVEIRDVRPIPIARSVTIQLWEQDSAGRNDKIDTFTVNLPYNFDFSRNYTHQFRWRRSVADDASYTLEYQVNRRRSGARVAGQNPCVGV